MNNIKVMSRVFYSIFFLSLFMMIYLPITSYLNSDNHRYPEVGIVMMNPAYPPRECEKSRDCMLLAEVGYYEARNQSDDGVLAVMQTVLNRVNHRRWGKTIREVIYDGCNFSYVCDGSKGRRISNNKQWTRMKTLAYSLLSGKISSPVVGSTHYHAKRVSPFWKKSYTKLSTIGDHIFYICKKEC